MRSAIFDKDPSRPVSDSRNPASRPRPFVSNSASANTQHKKAKSSSPYIGNLPETGTKPPRLQNARNSSSRADIDGPLGSRGPPDSASTAPSTSANLTWNFDEMVNSYNEKGSLPPLLSPTLPAQYSSKTDKSKKTPRISPDRSDSEPPGDSDPEAAERDNDDIPLCMLSPTLPSIFDKQTALVQPIPKKPDNTTLIDMADVSGKQGSVSLRWINKLADVKRPRFLVRMNFESSAQYRSKLGPGYAQPTKLQGLGILTDGNSKRGSQEAEEREKPREKEIAPREHEERRKIEREDRQKTEREEREKESRRKEVAKTEKPKPEEDLVKKEKDQRKPDISKPVKKETPRPDSFKQNKLPPPKLPEKPSLHKEDVKNNLNNKKNYWIKIARTCQRQAEQTQDLVLSLVMNLDSIILFMISYDYDEKLKRIADILPSERYWVSAYSDITALIDQLEKSRSSIDTQSKLRNYIPFFIGLLYQSKTAVLRRANSILQKVIDLYTKKSSHGDIGELNGKIIELQQQCMANFSSMISDTAKGQEYISKSPSISINFPKTWQRRSPQMNPHEGSDASLFPGGDKYYLPIGIYSDIREVSGLLFNSLKEFSETVLTEKENVVRYKLQSGQKGSSSAS